jgi:hypothetical protein
VCAGDSLLLTRGFSDIDWAVWYVGKANTQTSEPTFLYPPQDDSGLRVRTPKTYAASSEAGFPRVCRYDMARLRLAGFGSAEHRTERRKAIVEGRLVVLPEPLSGHSGPSLGLAVLSEYPC